MTTQTDHTVLFRHARTVEDQRAQTTLAIEERDDARRQLAASEADLATIEAANDALSARMARLRAALIALGESL